MSGLWTSCDRWRLWTLTVALSCALCGCASKPTETSAAMVPPATDVLVSTVQKKDVAIYGDWVATLDGYVNANIQPQVSGYLIKQNYREGSLVHKDDVLFEIDPRPFQAVLDQAKGQLAQAKGQVAAAEGQLGQARAQLGLSEINVKRDTPLAAARAIPQSQLDNDVQGKAQAEATVKTAEASIQAAQAAVTAAEAAVESAALNLGFTRVRSLIDGIAGTATTQVGSLVSPTTVLTAISQVDPIKVYFPISEQEYLSLAERLKSGTNLLAVPLQLTLANGNLYPHQGHIIFAERQVDTQTGTIRMVGAFANPGNILRPGQFGRIRAQTGFRKDALMIPQRAVTEMQGRYQVAVVGADNKVTIHTVEPGERVGDLWIINKGLSPDERVVSEGTSKVREGAVVNPKPDAAPQ